RDDAVVGVLDLDEQPAGVRATFAQALAHPQRETAQLLLEDAQVGFVLSEGVFAADALALALGRDGPVVAAVRQVPQVAAVLAEACLQLDGVSGAELLAVADPQEAQALGGAGPDAVEFLDAEALDEPRRLFG